VLPQEREDVMIWDFWLVVVVFFLLIFTKLADVFTTMKRLEDLSQETNPLARSLMKTLGTQASLWFIFGLFFLLAAASALSALGTDNLSPNKFIAAGLMFSGVQAAVAVTNWTGKLNWITKILMAYFNWSERAVRRFFRFVRGGIRKITSAL
jgi:hypothetical protein